jgi:N-acetylglucosaminyl-diphospho-decaprenol L-rhamnosyltransferase
MTPAIAAIIVNYNAGSELRAALQSVVEAIGRNPWEAVVVDNASTDGSETIVGEFAPLARLIRNTENVGFARGVNQGIAATRGPGILVMNPDCRLDRGAIETLLGELNAHPSCAIVGPRILNPDGSVQGSARGDPDMLTGLFGRTSALRRLLPGLPVARRNVVTDAEAAGPEKSVVVDWVSGACMLARRDALEAVGGFDEGYFMYWEDADLCRRLRGRGCHVRYVPGAFAVHQIGQSSRTARAASIRAFHASAYRYYATHVAPGPLNPKRAAARVLLAARCAWQLSHAKFNMQNSNDA